MILWVSQFQCPHGLELLLGMIARIIGTILFQCPLGLIPHFYEKVQETGAGTRAVSMPSRAYTSFLLTIWLCHLLQNIKVSMPSRAYTSFLRHASIV